MAEAEISKKSSTDSDIKLLNECYPHESLTVGRFIPYGELEDILKINRKLPRWNSVVNKWRKQLLELAGIDLQCRINEGYFVADNGQRLNHANGLQKEAIRKIRKSVIVAGTIDTSQLSNEQKESYVKLVNRNANIIGNSAMKREMPQCSL